MALSRKRMKTIALASRMTYEVNLAFAQSQGQDEDAPHWADADKALKAMVIEAVQDNINRIERGEEFAPKAAHDAYFLDAQKKGWSYGPKYDPVNKLDPGCLPYEMLPHEIRVMDFMCNAVCQTVMEILEPTPASRERSEPTHTLGEALKRSKNQ